MSEEMILPDSKVVIRIVCTEHEALDLCCMVALGRSYLVDGISTFNPPAEVKDVRPRAWSASVAFSNAWLKRKLLKGLGK